MLVLDHVLCWFMMLETRVKPWKALMSISTLKTSLHLL